MLVRMADRDHQVRDCKGEEPVLRVVKRQIPVRKDYKVVRHGHLLLWADTTQSRARRWCHSLPGEWQSPRGLFAAAEFEGNSAAALA